MRAIYVAILFGCAAIMGCGPDIRGTCEAQVSCRGGNDKDIEACVALQEVYVDFLDDINCGDEYDAYATCLEPYQSCRSIQTGQPCATDSDCGGGGTGTCSSGQCVEKSFGVDSDDADKCKAESRAMSRCANF